MARRAEATADLLLAEREHLSPGGPSAYLGAADTFVDVVLERFRGGRGDA